MIQKINIFYKKFSFKYNFIYIFHVIFNVFIIKNNKFIIINEIIKHNNAKTKY